MNDPVFFGDEAEPLGDEHYPGNDEYEDVDGDGGSDAGDVGGADDREDE